MLDGARIPQREGALYEGTCTRHPWTTDTLSCLSDATRGHYAVAMRAVATNFQQLVQCPVKCGVSAGEADDEGVDNSDDD